MTEILATIGILLIVAGILYLMLRKYWSLEPAVPVQEVSSTTENGQMSRVFTFPLRGYRSVQVIFKGMDLDQETAAQHRSGLEIELFGKEELVAPIQVFIKDNVITIVGTNADAAHLTGRATSSISASSIITDGDIVMMHSTGPKSEDQVGVKITMPFGLDFTSDIIGL